MPDLNLLVALDVLLAEGNVARAAQRMRLSPSAMSRTLARLRQVTGDPLLVRAGRTLTATPRALELRDRVGHIVSEAQALLRPVNDLNPRMLERTFVLRTSDGFVENFGPSLIRRVEEEAPGVRISFLQKPDRDSALLRSGDVDLETGVVSSGIGPEIRTQALFRDRFVGVVSADHPWGKGGVTPKRYLAGRHIQVSRGQPDYQPLDQALAELGLARDIVAVVGGFATAVALARSTDLIASVPERHTETLRYGMRSFKLPFAIPPFTVSMLWHPRLDADPALRWLRRLVKDVCSDTSAER